ncbi:succinyl-diaminopimelate desuccinylase [Agrococcus sp. ARC_14]|uniref:succinyl-diaminopimelate desuccinylase n=1 Tax=Agrococcus sp. ARC_14 TaxID=2919927 RepID=UPI001F05D3B1|nr:succinyl-diaminopimelate desuccinylase [Agrococcus sp. ARC_14]MCH1882606.1 succinyl-diaminopimelate desuccinylase [Agrococcus sp. ARC_14]
MTASPRDPLVLDLTASAADLTRQLCDIESVSDDEGRIADAIEAAARAATHLEVTRIGDTVIARTQLGRERRVVLAGHIDTVPINGNVPTRDAVVDGEPHIWGRGTVDMKAGVAVQLKLAVELAEPVFDVTWIWYDHEEVGEEHNGLRRLAAAHPELMQADFAILGEPSNGEIEGGCNGTLRAEIRTRGVRAHSARAWVGHNAIHDAAEILQVLQSYRPREVDVEGLRYREGLNAVMISGGVATNVIPDECVVQVNYRFAPSRSVEEATSHVVDLFEGFDVRVVDASAGARPGLDAPLAKEFIEAVGATPQPKYGWTDVARFSALGIPAVNFGPGDPSKAHADDESVPVAQIVATEESLRTWLSRA